MTIPILEFDSTPFAFIEPINVKKHQNVPESCVICFFKEVNEKIISSFNAKIVAENRWEDGFHHLYEISYKNQRLAFFHPGVGAPLASALLEEVIAFGCRKYFVCGGCGVLEKDISVGQPIVVTGAIRDEGVSYHYLPPDREIIANKEAVKTLVKILKKRKIPFKIGKTWTTDAPYRETAKKVTKRKEEGCIAVEMESAGLMAVAKFRNVILGQVIYGGDDLSGKTWDNRAWHSIIDIREKLFWICADACLEK
jgi:uridine phosphorylase